MARAELRVGLIGYGLAGEAFHAPLIAAAAGLRLASVVTSDPERATRAARDHPGVRVLSRAEELFRAATEHDLVVVATPNRFHVPLAEAALEAGLHVVVDKPLATSAARGRRLVEAAARSGLVLAVFHNRRLDGDFLTVRRLLEEDALGAPRRFESRFDRWRPELRADAWRELARSEQGGGLLFDLGSHLIDQALVLFGPAVRVYAEVGIRRPGAVVDDDVFLALTHRSGVQAHLSASHVAPLPGPRLRVIGSRAAYVKWGLDVQEQALRAGMRPGAGDWGADPPERWGTLGAGTNVRPVETERGDYPRFYAQLVAAIRDGAPVPVAGEDGVAVLEVIEAALASARGGRVVAL
jgi:scyllo-inositol 2-dehydrogenase (NADP+)